MRAHRVDVADDKFGNSCWVCSKVVKVTGGLTTKDLTACSKVCHQLFVFCQGLICGHALCSLVTVRVDEINRQTSRFSRNDFAACSTDGNFKDLEKLIKTEPDVPDTETNCGTDPPANVFEELLQVTFDKDCDGSQNCDPNDDDTDIENGLLEQLESSCSPANYLPSAQKLPSTCRLTTATYTSVSKHTDSYQTPQRLKLCGKKKHRVKHPPREALRQKTEIACVNQTGSALGDLSHHTEQNGTRISGKKKVICDVCGEKFVETHLHIHMKAKHTEKLNKEESDLMFPCSECNKKFDKQSHLNKHLAKKHPGSGQLTKSCTICHKGFSNQIGLSVHMRHIHKTLSPKECDLCQRTFKSCKELSRHKLRDHKLRVHICHLCGKKFAYGHALKSHLDAHAGVKKHFCETCGEGFVRMTSLCGHRISAHSKKDETVHKCGMCDSSYTSKSLLNKHLFEAHFTGPYAVKDYKKQKCVTQDQNCQTCKNTDDQSSKCSLHSANEAKQFICSHCGKHFSKAHYLKAHEKQHQEAKFSCDVCCKRFTYKCNLKAHKSTHSSDKPFQCTVCSKKFRLKFLLDDHQRTHNRDLLFKCYVCGRGLTRIPNLKRHIRVMHPEVSYEQNILNVNENI